MVADCLIHNTSEVLTCAGPAPRIGARQADAASRPRAVVAAHRGTIVFVGSGDDWRRDGALTDDATTLDAAGGAVVPGFVDPHTHVVFAGDRRDERRRLGGASYANAAGGGIVAGGATRGVGEALVAGAPRLDDAAWARPPRRRALRLDLACWLLRAVAAWRHAAMELSPTFMGLTGSDEFRDACRLRR
jgi:imidazolonepropionase